MKIVTHKFDKGYAVNLVDHTGRPLKTTIVNGEKEKLEESMKLAKENKVNRVYHNNGYTIMEKHV